MICPTCRNETRPLANYCSRCRTHFNPSSLFFIRCRDHLFWIFRRSNAGFLTGVVAWFFIPALSRVITNSSFISPVVHFMIIGGLGGSFLGAVDGMIDESTPKTFFGALLGGLGGLLGGLVFGLIKESLSDEQLPWGIFLYWSIIGGFIGGSCAFWERNLKKLSFGILFGLLGGGIGGTLGYIMYPNLIHEFSPETWYVRRSFEGLSGGVIGVTLWFVMATAQRFFIFKRRPLKNEDHKKCDYCQSKNPLRSWYCEDCGSVLQESAPAGKLKLSPYHTLERIRAGFRFLSRFSATTGIIAAVVIFVVFIPVNPILAVVVLVVVGLVSYSAQILFSSVSELLSIAMKE